MKKLVLVAEEGKSIQWISIALARAKLIEKPLMILLKHDATDIQLRLKCCCENLEQ
jgi:hypothetical protein